MYLFTYYAVIFFVPNVKPIFFNQNVLIEVKKNSNRYNMSSLNPQSL